MTHLQPLTKVEDLFSGFSFSNKPAPILPKTSRIGSFVPHPKSDQKQRRESLLQKQREERNKLANKLRERALDESDESEEETEKMEKEQENTRELNLIRTYRDILMLPEQLLEIPEDFEKWTAVPFPDGVRCTVAAKNGSTFARLESGVILVDKFSSMLPGGSHRYNRGGCCFDCIYVESEQTFYVLDMLRWRELDFRGIERDCRYFMMNSKLEETHGIGTIKKGNDYKFIPLTSYPCNLKNMEVIMTKYENSEGVLFYHEESIYLSERTPLMCGISMNQMTGLIENMKKAVN